MTNRSFNKEMFITELLYCTRLCASLIIVPAPQWIYHLINHTLFFIGFVLLPFLFIDVFALYPLKVLYEQRSP